jgi:hypothetical protein
MTISFCPLFSTLFSLFPAYFSLLPNHALLYPVPRSDVHLTARCHSTGHRKISSQANVGGCSSQARVGGHPAPRSRSLAAPRTHRCRSDFAHFAPALLLLTTLPGTNGTICKFWLAFDCRPTVISR